jgi:hypothetical protein
MDDANEPKPTVAEKDAAYLQLLCAAVTGLASQHEEGDMLWQPEILADHAAEIADQAFDKWSEAYEYHRS